MKETYKFKKAICYVYHDNIRSKKLLKKLHFVKFDESYYYDDEGYVKRYRGYISRCNLFWLFKKLFLPLGLCYNKNKGW